MSAPVDVLAVLVALGEQARRHGGYPSFVTIEMAIDAVAELIRCDLDYDDVTDGARWRALPDERVCELACRYCGDDAATRERITAAVKAARMHAIARVQGGAA